MAGYVNKFGYCRVRIRGSRKLRMQHVLVWEAHHGPVPKGMELHHINGDKLDNRIENLKLVTRLEHKRIHSGCELRDGIWWKPCRRCGEMKPVTEYYRKSDGIFHMCKKCTIYRAVFYKRQRRERARQQDLDSGGAREGRAA